MTTLQVQFLVLIVLVAAIAAFAGSQLALADGATVRTAWGRAGLAAAAAALDLGALYEALDLGRGAPSPARAGSVGLGVLGAVMVSVVAYGLASDRTRGRRWSITAGAFTAAMGVLTVVAKIAG
ncbi:hypothetical protein [Streptomyces alboflavus]|uniref:hypothetical protein n=1 Tax=Streptomyces alboflavus TaxID=67267 RepID=UPI000F658091|nr:hypothetical protein [Streptomyces alboflavus]